MSTTEGETQPETKGVDVQSLLNSLTSIENSQESSESELEQEFAAKLLGVSPQVSLGWWEQMKQTLQDEVEKKVLDQPTPPTARSRSASRNATQQQQQKVKRKSWIESKDKINMMLESKETLPGLDQPVQSVSSDQNWWENLKGELSQDNNPTTAETTNVEAQSSGNWWGDMKQTLDNESTTSGTSNRTSIKPDSGNDEKVSSDWWANLQQELDEQTGAKEKSNVPPQTLPNDPRGSLVDWTPPPHNISASSTPTLSPVKGDMVRERKGSVSSMSSDEGGIALKILNGTYRGDTVYDNNGTATAHGYGVFTGSNSEVYIGQWNHGKRHGRGLRTWKDGREYIGNWENNKRTGEGMVTFPNGDVYIGETQYGFQNGKGMYIYANGDRYIGDWTVGEKQGFGVLYHKNGDAFYGEWKHNKKDGFGLFRSADGRIKEGVWKDNKFTARTGSKRDGQSTCTIS